MSIFLLNQHFHWSPEFIDRKKVNVKFQFQIICTLSLETRVLYVQIEMFLLLRCVSSEFDLKRLKLIKMQ